MGHKTSTGKGDLKLLFGQIKGLKKGETITIALKDAETKEVVADANEVSGTVTKVETVEKVYEGVAKDVLRIWLRDNVDKELILLSCGMNSIGRNIVNALASVEGELGDVNISVYMNKKGYPSVSVKHNGKRLDWKYSLDEQKKYITTTEKVVKGEKGAKITKIERNFIELDELFIAEWKNLATKVNPKFAAISAPAVAELTGVAQEDAGDDLPF